MSSSSVDVVRLRDNGVWNTRQWVRWWMPLVQLPLLALLVAPALHRLQFEDLTPANYAAHVAAVSIITALAIVNVIATVYLHRAQR